MTEKILLQNLLEKLKGKPVYATFQKILAGETNPYVKMKGYSSLLTWSVIECEHGHTEYSVLCHMLYEKIGEILLEIKD